MGNYACLHCFSLANSSVRLLITCAHPDYMFFFEFCAIFVMSVYILFVLDLSTWSTNKYNNNLRHSRIMPLSYMTRCVILIFSDRLCYFPCSFQLYFIHFKSPVARCAVRHVMWFNLMSCIQYFAMIVELTSRVPNNSFSSNCSITVFNPDPCPKRLP